MTVNTTTISTKAMKIPKLEEPVTFPSRDGCFLSFNRFM